MQQLKHTVPIITKYTQYRPALPNSTPHYNVAQTTQAFAFNPPPSPHTHTHTHTHTCSCHHDSLSCSITRRSSCSSLFRASSPSILLRWRARVELHRDSLFSSSSLALESWGGGVNGYYIVTYLYVLDF